MDTPYPLLDAHPALAVALPTPLGLLRPTPLESVDGWPGVRIKRDDLSADGYGGNKVRKLDFLLADARDRGRRSVLCFGYAGSNFVAATAWHAHAIGLRTLGFLLPQAPADYVVDNLRTALIHGAELHGARTTPGLVALAVARSLRHAAGCGQWPVWVPPGGSSPLGAIGFVNAGLEFARQLAGDDGPLPERIYIAFSSMGSVAGLALGLELAGLPVRVHAVRVVDAAMADERKLATLIRRTARRLAQGDCAVDAAAALERVEIRGDYYGPGYAQATPAVHGAIRQFGERTGLRADSAYSGKALGCLMDDLADSPGRPVVYWHTFAGAPAAGPGAPVPPGVPRLLRHHLADGAE